MRLTKRIPARPALRLQALEDRTVPSFGLGWAFNMAANSGWGVATDNSGSVYVSGNFLGTTNFDPNNTNPSSNHVLTATGQADSFVAKYLADGTFQWATDVGPEVGGYAPKVAVQGTAVYARFPAANADGTDNSAGVSRLDPTTGAVVWTTVLPSTSGGAGGVRVGPTGDAYTVWQNPAGQLSVSRIGYSSGNLVWTTTSTDKTNGGLTVDSSGNAYVLATLPGSATFGNTTLTSWSSSDTDIAIWKLDASGGSVWAGKIGSNGSDGWGGAAVDGSGNVYVVGSWGSGGSNQSLNNNFNPGSGNAVRLSYKGGGGNNGSDIFIVKLAQDKKGAMKLAWAEDIGSNNGGAYHIGSVATAVAVDGAGNVYTTGDFAGTVNFNPGSGPAQNLTSSGIDSDFG